MRNIAQRSVLFALAVALLIPPCIPASGPNAGPRADTRPTLVFKQFAPGEPIHMIAYGDMRFTDPSVTSGTNPKVRKWLADKIGEEHPQVLLLTGDMPFYGAHDEDWTEFRKETASWWAEKTLVLPAPGNHELYGGPPPQGIANYLRNFPEIEGRRYYSALLGNVEVISLDGNLPPGPADPQAKWFAAQLDRLPPQVEFLLILYHWPWMADEQTELLINLPSKKALILRGILEARLSRMHAKVVVFNGHIHNYERFERDGVTYVVTGGGGAQPYPLLLRGPSDLYRDKEFPVYHYLTVEIAAHRLHAVMWKVKDPDAETLTVEQKDEFAIDAAPPPNRGRKNGPPRATPPVQ